MCLRFFLRELRVPPFLKIKTLGPQKVTSRLTRLHKFFYKSVTNCNLNMYIYLVLVLFVDDIFVVFL